MAQPLLQASIQVRYCALSWFLGISSGVYPGRGWRSAPRGARLFITNRKSPRKRGIILHHSLGIRGRLVTTALHGLWTSSPLKETDLWEFFTDAGLRKGIFIDPRRRQLAVIMSNKAREAATTVQRTSRELDYRP